MVHVNPNRPSAGADLLRCNEHVKATATAQIDHHFALMCRYKEGLSLRSDGSVHVFEAHLFQICQGKRIATTKPKVGIFWYGFEFILGITKGSCDVCVRIGFMSIANSIDRVISVSFIYLCRDVGWCKVLLQAHGFTITCHLGSEA